MVASNEASSISSLYILNGLSQLAGILLALTSVGFGIDVKFDNVTTKPVGQLVNVLKEHVPTKLQNFHSLFPRYIAKCHQIWQLSWLKKFYREKQKQ